jgi:hypothetical protein
MRRSICLILSALICSLAISQSIRPLYTTTLSSAPQAAALHQSVLRHSVEEVSSKPLESARTESIKFVPSDGALDQASAPARLDEIDATDWRSNCLFHRRTAPSSTDDGN